MTFEELARIGMEKLSKQQGVSLEEMRAQVVRLFKSQEQPLTPQEQKIWSKTSRSEYERVCKINAIRAKKKRAEFLLRKHQWEEEIPQPTGSSN